MEVHHHTHHPKKWKEYITEFLMLFLAVSLGFIAENIREEQVVEHQTESVLSQLRQELILDTAQLNSIKKAHEKLDSATSFIAYYIKTNTIEQNLQSFFLLHGYNTYRSGIFETNCIAMDQLKFTGLLKNIKNDSLRLHIENYNLSLKALEGRSQRENNFMDNHVDEIKSMPFNIYKSYKPSLEQLNTEKGKTLTEADVYCNGLTLHITLLKTFLPDNIELKKFDKNKYLNIVLELNGIRNSTQDRQYDMAFKRATLLLQSLESVYPQIIKD